MRVRELLLAHASCELGKERVRAMAPLTDLREIEQRQAETRGMSRDRGAGGIPWGFATSAPRWIVPRDGILRPRSCWMLPTRSYSARRLKFFFARYRSRFRC